MADGGDAFAVAVKLAEEAFDTFFAAKFVGHPAAGANDAVKVGTFDIVDAGIGDTDQDLVQA